MSGKARRTNHSEDEMHPDISRQIMIDHVATLRREAAASRQARRIRRHLRNPRRTVAA